MKKLYSALMTAFNEDGTMNDDGIRAMVRYNIDVNHIDGLYVGGSTGEAFMMNAEERKHLMKVAFEEAAGKVDMIAMVGSINLQEAKDLADYAVNVVGYKTISAVTPFYYPFTFDQIKYYYDAILDGLDTQLLIYSLPALTGVSLTAEQFGRLFDNPKIIGIKFTNADFLLLERVRKAFPDKVIYFGSDEQMLSALVLGVDGAIGSTFNLNAKRAFDEIAAFEAGDMSKALELQHTSNDYIMDVIDNDLYPTIKLLFHEAGVDAGICRRPMNPPTAEMKAGAAKIYTKYFK
ncbi:N-acetylneuraminate lyase [Loigolactobacillus coryniformis subsp. coryniformis CECT 5711]|uniref:N-acetylneuraminate lyase n=2 Tax=Loigolactobacillus coryniformis TaxID=1610 RepID=J2Z4B8_9LACO|nr:N-acetylneuraminate lyase [Loigolactobacillus coryniformis subsp. coryniformis CECT 5711]